MVFVFYVTGSGARKTLSQRLSLREARDPEIIAAYRGEPDISPRLMPDETAAKTLFGIEDAVLKL